MTPLARKYCKLTEAEAEAQFNIEKSELDEASKPENVLKMLQFDADLEKKRLMDRLNDLSSSQETEKIRQAEMARQKLARLNAKKDATQDAIFELIANQGAVLRGRDEERIRQQKLAKARLEMYRNNRKDLDMLKITDNMESDGLSEITDYPLARGALSELKIDQPTTCSR